MLLLLLLILAIEFAVGFVCLCGNETQLLPMTRQVRGQSQETPHLPLSLSLYLSDLLRCGNCSCLKGRATSLSRQSIPGDISASNLSLTCKVTNSERQQTSNMLKLIRTRSIFMRNLILITV